MSYLKYIIKYLKHSQTLVLIIIIYQANVVPKASFFVPSDIVPNVYNKLWVGGIATGLSQWGHAPPPPPHFNFQTKKGPTFSLSKIRSIASYGCSEIIRTRNFTIFTVLQFSDNLQRHFIFSNYVRKIDRLRLDLLRRSDT